MKKRFKNILLISLMGLFACSSDPKELNEITTNYIVETPSKGITSPEEISYHGKLIFLDEQEGTDEVYIIPRIEEKREDITFRAKRVPMDLYLLNKGVPKEELDQELAKMEGEQLFYFEFEEFQKQDLFKKYFPASLDKSVSYLSFDIQNDFQVIDSEGKEHNCAYSVYERDFGIAPYERILIGFTGVDEEDELTLVYRDVLFQKGEMEFAFAPKKYVENNTKNPS